MHTTPSILQFLIFFRFLLIVLFQMAVHMTRLEENGQPLQRVVNQLMIKMVQRGNRRIKIKQKVTKDEVSVTDTEQQTSEH